MKTPGVRLFLQLHLPKIKGKFKISLFRSSLMKLRHHRSINKSVLIRTIKMVCHAKIRSISCSSIRKQIEAPLLHSSKKQRQEILRIGISLLQETTNKLETNIKLSGLSMSARTAEIKSKTRKSKLKPYISGVSKALRGNLRDHFPIFMTL
jgi:hypothetical protein